MAGTAPSQREAWVALAGKDLPLEAEAVFPEGEGLLERRRARARARLLGALAPTLARALEPGERVRYAARGVDREAAAAGYLAQLANQTALVLTDRRLLLFQVASSGAARDVKNQVRLTEVSGARSGLLAGFEIRLADGKKIRLVQVPGASRRALAAALPRSEGAPPRPAGAPPSLEHLCPACLGVVPGKVGAAAVCPNPTCRIPFRDPGRAQWLSVLLPGLGDLYLRHYFLGALQLVVSVGFLTWAVGMALQAALVGLDEAESVALLIPAVLLVVLPRAFGFFMTRHMARKGIVPLAERASPAALRSLPAFPGWAYGLFLAAAAGFAAGVVAMAREGRVPAEVAQARREARAGRFDEAAARWQRVAPSADDHARARMAIAFYRAGDYEHGDDVGEPLAGRRLSTSLAREYNGFLARKEAAFKDYGAGLEALARGRAAEAGPALDRALAFFRTVRRPDLPQTLGDARLELAAAMLAPPVTEAAAAQAERFWSEAADGQPARRAVVLASAQAQGGRSAQAAQTLGALDEAALPPAWRLLALETRLRLSTTDAERQVVVAAARAMQPGRLATDKQRERLKALLARGR